MNHGSRVEWMLCKGLRGVKKTLLRACASVVRSLTIMVFVAGPIAADVPDLPRLERSAMVYEGSFRVPVQDRVGTDMTYGGYALGIDPVRQGLYFACHDYLQQLAEVTVPPLGAVATLLQDCTDVTQGRLPLVDDYLPRLGGSLWHDGRLILSAFGDYDADHSQTRSHFVVSPDFSNTGGLVGPLRVGELAGMVAGYMTPIPTEWREAFGGPALTGQCCVNIIGRSSAGPAASVFDPGDLGAIDPVEAQMLLGYPLEHALAEPESQNPWFNLTTRIVSLAFPPGSRSLLFIGRHGTGPYCYDTAEVCDDPADPYKGPHAWPYIHQVWAYDALDLVRVQQGELQPWDPRPYAVWTLPEMDQTQSASVAGATYDPANGRLYITEAFGEDVDSHQVHVYRISVPATDPVTAHLSVHDKTYDGTRAALIASCSLSGVADGDHVTCSGAAASFADANAGVDKTVTVTGVTLAGADAGKYSLSRSTYTTTASILQAAVTVTLGDLIRTYTGSPLAPRVTTTPAGLSIDMTGAPQTNAGSYYPVTATVSNPNYQGSASGTFVINRAAQPALILTATPDRITIGGAGSTLAVSGGVAGPVTYDAVPSPEVQCHLIGHVLTASGTAGTCTVTASHPGTANHLPATSNPVTVSVTQPPNAAPVAVDDRFALPVAGTAPVALAAPGVLANDTDDGDGVLRLAGVAPRTLTLPDGGGQVTLRQDGGLVYRPPSATFSGARTFIYQATDGVLRSNTATVTLTIVRRPTARNDSATTSLDTAKEIHVLANDRAFPPARLDPAAVEIVSAPANGTAQPNSNGTVTYRPRTGFAGTDTLTYSVRDSLGTASNPARVTMQVPQARPDSYRVAATASTRQTVRVAATDGVAINDVPNATGRIFTKLSNPVRIAGSGTGTLTLIEFSPSSGAFAYRVTGTQKGKRGTFQFTYRMTLNRVPTAPATVTISVD